MKIWDKDNILVKELSGEFEYHGALLHGLPDNLIKIPTHSTEYFFTLYEIFEEKIKLMTSEPLNDNGHGIYGYYEISMDDDDFDEDMPIELYDPNSKEKVKTITVKDLYRYYTLLNADFVAEADNKVAIITIHTKDGNIKYIGRIEIGNTSVLFRINILFMNRQLTESDIRLDVLTCMTIDRIRDMDVTVQVLSDKDSLITAINEIGYENIE